MYDVQWSPIHPALFAAVDGMGKLDLWNLNLDTEVRLLYYFYRSGSKNLHLRNEFFGLIYCGRFLFSRNVHGIFICIGWVCMPFG